VWETATVTHAYQAVSVAQAKQQETGWDIDARLLLYADAIKRTEMLTSKFASAGQPSPSPDTKQTSSDPAVADSLNCQDGMPKGLHIKTRCELIAVQWSDHCASLPALPPMQYSESFIAGAVTL